MTIKHLPTILIALILAACSPSSVSRIPTETILPAPQESPNIFKFYSSKEDAKLTDGWARSFDMSGVSFDSRKTATLVTPRHVVMANHYKRNPGDVVVFHDRQGTRLERSLISVKPVIGDVAVGLLNEDVPKSHKIYPLPTPDTDPSQLINKLVAITDQNRRIFFHHIRAIHGSSIGFRYDKSRKNGWSKTLVGGDSGNPSFLIKNDTLILLETHTTGGPGGGPFYGSPELQKALQNRITELSPGYRLRFKKP